MASGMAATLNLQLGPALAEGTLKKTGEPYSIHGLASHHLPLALDVQARVLAELGPEAYYLVPKTRAQFFGFLHNWPLACMYGICVSDHYAGQIILRLQVKPAEHARNIAAIADLHDYALLQGALTHPAWRGRGLLTLLLGFINQQVLPSIPAQMLLARVVPENIVSWGLFLQAGYKIVAAEPDPDDERRVFYLGYGLPPKMGETRLLEATDYAGCQKLCRAGWHAVAFNAPSGLLTFQR